MDGKGKVSEDYVFFVWRREMGQSEAQMLATDYARIHRDLAYMRIEDTIKASNQVPVSGKTPNRTRGTRR